MHATVAASSEGTLIPAFRSDPRFAEHLRAADAAGHGLQGEALAAHHAGLGRAIAAELHVTGLGLYPHVRETVHALQREGYGFVIYA
ncbi:MAG TPA: hypothetical protein VJB16_00120, partial [archaeon]|nr:hypothetical protein [archaeon]